MVLRILVTISEIGYSNSAFDTLVLRDKITVRVSVQEYSLEECSKQRMLNNIGTVSSF